MKGIFLVIGFVGLVAMGALAAQDAPQSERSNEERTLLSNVKVGEWISFNDSERGLTIQLLKKPADLTIDAWHEQVSALRRERNALMEPFQPRRVDRTAKLDQGSDRPEDTQAKRLEAQAKAAEIETRIQKFGISPYEITGIYKDHLAIRSNEIDIFLAAGNIRYISRYRDK